MTLNQYELNQSPFFRLRSKSKLADLLQSSKRKMISLAKSDKPYQRWPKKKASGGVREIAAPRGDLSALQSRISDLLGRVEKPAYLFAPRKGVSYVDNAAAHLISSEIVTIDIKDFFANCSSNYVKLFFLNKMECSPDVAAILTELSTLEGRLPQGSPASPVLSFLSYQDMWDEISQLCQKSGCMFSLYIDDITISGRSVPGRLVWQVRRLLGQYGHVANARKTQRRRNRPMRVTGVIVHRGRLLLPNRQHKKYADLKAALADAKDENRSADLRRRLVGHRAQAAQISSRNRRRGR